MVSPFIGSFLENMFKKNIHQGSTPIQLTCDFAGFVLLAFGVILFIGNCGFNVFSENRKFQSALNKLHGHDDSSIKR